MNQIKTHQELCEKLAFYADDEYRDFVMKICPSERPFLGVRVPQIREIAGQVAPECIEKIIATTPIGYEETLARAFLIARLPYEKLLEYFDSQVDYIDDWSTCDTFCSAVGKMIKKHRTDFYEKKMENLLSDEREFAVRVGLVLLKCCYMEPDWLQVIYDYAERLASRDEYYVKMALAWLICECFIKFPKPTLGYLRASHLPKWTFNKAISKICDSYRVEPEMKDLLRKMRR